MKNKVCIIICYFGHLPDTIGTFFYSCKKNSEFSWMIVTDNTVKDAPDNVKIVRMTLRQVKELASEKLNMDINLEMPYKLCDYKVAYGLIFEDFIKEYDFWGYGDLDVVYGDLKSFVTDEVLDKYDKIYPLGHLSLMRNNEMCCKLFMKETDNTRSYKNVFNSDASCFFDEDRGINDKLEANGLRIYSKFDFADIDGIYKRFRNVDKKVFKIVTQKFQYGKDLRKNYKHQVFYYSDGHLYQRYVKNKMLLDEELSYIHYRRRLPVKWKENDAVMIFSPEGILGAESVPDKYDIDIYNQKSENETLVFLKFAHERLKKRLPAELKDKTISILGKSKLLRKAVRKIKSCFKNAEEK